MELGVSGQVRLGNLIAYDKKTDTHFLQETGEALNGPLAGSELAELGEEQCNIRTRWEDWHTKYPHSLVMLDPKNK